MTLFKTMSCCVQTWTNETRTRKYEREHAQLKNYVRGDPIMARHRYIWKFPIPNFVTVIKLRATLTGMERDRTICVLWFIFSRSRFICLWLYTDRAAMVNASRPRHRLLNVMVSDRIETEKERKNAGCLFISLIGSWNIPGLNLIRMHLRSMIYERPISTRYFSNARQSMPWYVTSSYLT